MYFLVEGQISRMRQKRI